MKRKILGLMIFGIVIGATAYLTTKSPKTDLFAEMDSEDVNMDSTTDSMPSTYDSGNSMEPAEAYEPPAAVEPETTVEEPSNYDNSGGFE